MQAAALYRSSIGKKALMAITGVIWIGYVVMHMYGNLKVFQGAEHFNAYAEGLRYLGAPDLWASASADAGAHHLGDGARRPCVGGPGALSAGVDGAAHVVCLAQVVQANYAALTMRYGGILLLLFVFFHLMQLTWGAGCQLRISSPATPITTWSRFQSWPVVVIYLMALVALGFHLYHGTWSMFQTLGLNSREWDAIIRGLAWLISDRCAGRFCGRAHRGPIWHFAIASEVSLYGNNGLSIGQDHAELH